MITQNYYTKLSLKIITQNYVGQKRLNYRDTGISKNIIQAITKWGAIEKSPILLSQYWINEEFELIQ